MFTGIIEFQGSIEASSAVPGGIRLRIRCPGFGRGLAIGESVAVDGVCLTVTARGAGWFDADISPETSRRTTLGRPGRGRVVNLERPLAATGRLGGHFVQGHVDATAAVRSIRRGGEFTEMAFEAPRALRPFLVEKGSVAVNGVSLTVASLRGGRFTVALIPHTLKETNLSSLKSGSKVNIEVDILAKYVRSFLDR